MSAERVAVSPVTDASGVRLIALPILLVLFVPLGIDLYLSALPIIAETFVVDVSRVQDSVSWFMCSLGLGQLLAGPLADRFGRRPIALMGVVIFIVSALMVCWAQTLEQLLAARLLQGLGACATSVAAFAAVRDSFGAERSGRMISYLNAAICVVPALAPLLGSWLTHHFGWRSNFVFMAGFALVAGAAISAGFKETRSPVSSPGGGVISLERYWSVLAERSFLFHATLCMLAMAVILAYVTAAPVWLMTELGLDMSQFTVWFGANAFVNIFACMVVPQYMDRFGVTRTLQTGLLILPLAAALMLSLSGVAEAWTFMLPVFLSSFGLAFVLAAAAGSALAPFGDRAGTAAALLGLFQMSGAGLLVTLAQRLPLTAPVLLALQMSLLLPALWWLWMKGWRPRASF